MNAEALSAAVVILLVIGLFAGARRPSGIDVRVVDDSLVVRIRGATRCTR